MKAKILLLTIAIASCVACSTDERAKVKQPTRVKTETVTAGSQLEDVAYVGIVEENKSTAVSFTGMGLVNKVYVSEGQSVGRGQLLATIDGTQARNILAGAEAQMAQANDALARYSKIHDNGSLPEIQWVEIQSKVAQAKSQLAIARKNVADCRLIAPVSGVVGRINVNAGETAMPSQAVLSILDVNTVKIKVSIPEGEIGDINANTPSSVFVEAVNLSTQGGRIEKSVSADALTHTYDIRINVKNPKRTLLPGMVANVTFHGASNVGDGGDYSLPLTAVQKNASGKLFVWSIGNDSLVHRTPVAIGHTAGNRIAITSGLKAGQRIVVEGYQKLSEGTKVVF
ncbi:MAG: efflux RND transporter periplasmic adaptor subunit [Muribaculaceae bacterium]|nr:efflux RND transporter periplasmic adaptor subunit [Muribaculaceae bacterium]